MTRTYTVKHETDFEVTIEIDHDFIHDQGGESEMSMSDMIEASVDFWSNSEHRLEMNEDSPFGAYLATFLKQLCREVLALSVSTNLNEKGIMSELGEKEGWCFCDGKHGIVIKSIVEIDLDYQENYTIE